MSSEKVQIIDLKNTFDYQSLLKGSPQTCGMRSGRVYLKSGKECGQHSTKGNEEMLVFLSGNGTALIGKNKKKLKVGNGKVCYIPPHTIHNIRNAGKVPLVYIYCVTPVAIDFNSDAKTEIRLSPVGFIQNEFKEPSKTVHIRANRSKIILLPEYTKGLYRLKENKYLEVIFYFHKSKGYQLIHKTPHWGTRGVFASRSPFRPVPLGLTKVKLISVNKNELLVEGLDAINGTPVLDIKPYVNWSKQNKGAGHGRKKKRPEKSN